MRYSLCDRCNQEIGNAGFKRHYTSCTGQGKRKPPNGRGRGGWNRGLTTDDSRVAAYGQSISKALTGRRGHLPSEAHRKILSEMAVKNGLGGVRQSKKIAYNGHLLGSTYEVELAKSLDQNQIAWTTCARFSYIDFNGKKRSYTPDLYLPQFDVYLDPKNDFLLHNVNPSLGFTDEQKIKWVMEQNGIQVLILSKEQLSWKAVEYLLSKL